jgi:hypothetical protein
MARWSGLLVACLLAGCATPLPPTVQQARSALDGRGFAGVQSCMGIPAVVRSDGHVVLWSYPSAAGRAALASGGPAGRDDPTSAGFAYTPFDGDPVGTGLGLSQGPAASAGCLVNVVFDGGVVHAVTFVGPGGQLTTRDPACAALVQPCLK